MPDKRVDQYGTITPTGNEFILIQNPTTLAYQKVVVSSISGTGGAGAVTSVAGKTGVVTLAEADIANLTTDLAAKQPTLVSGTNIKTVNGTTLLGSGDIAITGGAGTVTSTSIVSANGFAGTVATPTTTPAITLTTTATGLLKGNGTAISAATSGTDYVVPSGSITGTAANVTGTVGIANGGTGVAALPTGILKGAGTGAITAVTAPTGAIVGTTDTQTLSSKTLDNTTIETIKAVNLTIQDGTDITKQAKFDASAITTATTRTYILPNAAGTIALTSSNITGTAAGLSANITESQVTNLVTDLAAKQGTLTLTTTGTSGAATLTGNTLNIPIYATGGGAAGITRSVTTITTAVTAGATALVDYVYLINTGGTLTMPTAVGNTNRYSIKNISAANTTVASTSSQTFDGSTLTLSPGASVDLISDGANYQIF